MVHGIDAYGHVCAPGDHVAVNNQRLLVIGSLLSPEGSGDGWRDAEGFVDAGSEVFTTRQGGTRADILAAFES